MLTEMITSKLEQKYLILYKGLPLAGVLFLYGLLHRDEKY